MEIYALSPLEQCIVVSGISFLDETYNFKTLRTTASAIASSDEKASKPEANADIARFAIRVTKS